MKKYFLIFLCVSISPIVHSQNLFTSFFAGISNYKGDIGNKAAYLSHSHPAWGVGCLYELNHRMLVSAEFNSGKISGADKFSATNNTRNLSFYSNVNECSVNFEYVLFDLYDFKVSPYGFVGLARFRFNPFTKNKTGLDVNLYEQSTEGQGFYEGRKAYKLTQTAIPIGAGMQWALSDNKRIGLFIGIRKTFTDYLDDVSTTYVDPAMLAQHRGSTAVTLAYRAGEVVPGSSYPVAGTRRGNPKDKDMYLFSGVSYRVRFTATNKRRTTVREDKNSNEKAKVTCPSF